MDEVEASVTENVNVPTKANDENVAPEEKPEVPRKRKTHRLKQRFTVVRKLGQGTYGKVQLAINNESGLEVAIKTIKKSKVESEKDLIRIRREIQIMSSIQHPHLVHIYEVFENKDKIVLVMQYASGGELYDYVSYHKVLTDSDARRLFRQVATAIYYCHKNKICHRDLKLENILLDEKGSAKIADFGLSNVFDERHFLQTFCGSPLYASPEIVRGQPYFGPEVDCWSLGVLLYTLVYGAMPFDGSNFKKLVKQISEANYYEPPEKSSASDLIRRLLAPNPRERATIIDICLDPWVNYDFDHSLLQLADDLSNLTPVRCDMIAALAPVSPGIVDSKPNDDDPMVAAVAAAAAVTAAVANNGEQQGDEQAMDEQMPKQDDSPVDGSCEDARMNEEPTKPTVDSTSSSQSAIDLDKHKPKADDDLSAQELPTESDLVPESAPESEQIREETPPEETVTEAVLESKTEDMKQPKKKKSSVKKSVDKSPSPEKGKKTPSIKSNRSSSSSIARSDSSGRRPGRLSIPKIWDSSTKIDKTPSKTSVPRSDSVNSSISSFIPVGMRVNEARKALERRCSIDVNRQSPLVKRRESSPAVPTVAGSRPPLKKYSARSLSLNENEMSKSRPSSTVKPTAKKVAESKASPEKVVEDEKEASPVEAAKKQASPEKTPPVTSQSSTPSTPITEEDKSLAKQIINKSIARALGLPAKPYGMTSNSPARETETVRSENQKQLISQPITRSYKKVTFTKDGACITESGKVYTHQSKDGFGVKRIEKKSMVTHIIQGGNGSGTNNNGIKDMTGQDVEGMVTLQKSDSASSTGSTDIFDDIFEDHWSGDVFSNVKSIFNNIFENSNRRIAERRSIRSRAESLERPNDWFNSRFTEATKGSKFTFDKTDDDSGMYGNASQKSIFSNRSMFSSNFKSNFDKEFESMASSRMQSVSAKFNEKFKLLGQMDSVFDRNRQESSQQRVERWLQDDNPEKDDRMRIENYGTIGPKNFRRYIKTMNSADLENSDNNSSSNQMFKSSVQMSSSSSMAKASSKTMPGGEEEEGSDNKTPEDDDAFSPPQTGPINVEEQSSLLEQLRKFGYKKIIDRKLSESSSTEDATQESVPKFSKDSVDSSVMDRIYGSSSGLTGSGSSSTFLTSLRTRQQSIERMRPDFMTTRRTANRQEFQESSLDSSANNSPPRYSRDGSRNESVMERIHRKSYYSRFNEEVANSGSIGDRPRRRSITRPSDTMSDINSLTSSTSANNSSSNVRRGYDSPLILMNASSQSPFNDSYKTASSTASMNSSNNELSSFAASSKTMKESSTSSSSYVIYQTSKTVKSSSSSSSRSSTLFNSSQNSLENDADNLQDQLHKRISTIKREFSSSSSSNNNNNNSQQ